jgi:hypothetical protein
VTREREEGAVRRGQVGEAGMRAPHGGVPGHGSSGMGCAELWNWAVRFGLGPSRVLPFSFLFLFFVLFYPLFPNSKLRTKFKLCGTFVYRLNINFGHTKCGEVM